MNREDPTPTGTMRPNLISEKNVSNRHVPATSPDKRASVGNTMLSISKYPPDELPFRSAVDSPAMIAAFDGQPIHGGAAAHGESACAFSRPARDVHREPKGELLLATQDAIRGRGERALPNSPRPPDVLPKPVGLSIPGVQ
jgi:hypothetical protein